MRLDALHLKAFGPFTDQGLALDDGEHGVHVIYGPNEAGKSSALRAVRALLFGVPERTTDGFMHENQALRVGATVRPARGTPFTCFRRKGRKDTLLDASGKPMDQSVLEALLQGVDEARFRALFGIDHESLVAGGRSLLAEHGREAQALFGSGLGSATVHQVLEDLDRQAQDIFVAKGQKPRLNALLRELDDLRRQARDATLSATRWDQARQRRHRRATSLGRAQEVLQRPQVRRSSLERLRRTLPGLARLADLERRRAALGEAPALAPDFAMRRRTALDSMRTNSEALQRAATRLATLEEQMRELRLDPAPLDEADAIDALYARLGQRRRATAQRPALLASREHAAALLDERLAALSMNGTRESVDRRMLSARLAHRARAEALARQHEALEERVHGLEHRLAECTRKRERCRQASDALPGVVDARDLLDAVKSARALGEVDLQEVGLASRHQGAERDCAHALAALGRWRGSADALLDARLPDEVVLSEFEERFESLDRDERRRQERERAAHEQMRQAREALRAMDLAGPVPTEADLASARAHRDQGWALVKRAWLEASATARELAAFGAGADDGDGTDVALAAALEAAAGEADAVADRLRREAQRIHERAACLARMESCEALLAGLHAERQPAQRAHAELEQQWQAVWTGAGIEPGTVGEMSAWLQSALRLREQVQAMHAIGDELEAARLRRAAVRQRLAHALTAACRAGCEARGGPDRDNSLSPLLARAESSLEALDEQRRRRHALGEESDRLADEHAAILGDLKQANAAREGWRASWANLSTDLGLACAPEPAQLSAHFDGLQAAADLAEQLATLSQQLDVVDADSAAFAEETGALCRRVAPRLAPLAAEEVVVRLYGVLREQQQVHTRLAELRRQAELAREERDQARDATLLAERALDALCREAGGVERAALEAIEQRDREHRELAGNLDAVRAELLAQGDGASVADLRAAEQQADRDAVAGELQHIEHAIAESLEPQRTICAEACYAAQRDFEQMGGGAAAAELEAGARQLVASVREQAARFVRVRLAARVLREQIDRFRREHRDPILAAAGRYLRTLTEDDFQSVDTDFDSGDEAVLIAVRAGGEHLRVEALSTGTRDQLYLALRLAALDHYLERSEPLPFVVDDILVQFDDARTRATLKALAHFSRRTQVLLFTHHARVAEDARDMAGEGGGVFVHTL